MPTRRRSFTAALAALALSLSACELAGPQAAPEAVAPAAEHTLRGVVAAPPGFLGNAAGNLLGNASGTYRAVAHAAALGEVPLVGAEVFLADGSGKPVAGIQATETDALGRFELKNVPAGHSLMLVARALAADGREAQLRTLVVTGTAAEHDLDVAATYVTAALAGSGGALGELDASAFQRAVLAVSARLTPEDAAALPDAAEVNRRMEALASETAALRSLLDGMRAELARVSSSLAELEARVAALAAQAPAPKPSLAPAPVLGTYAVGAAPRNLLIDREGAVWVANYKDDSVTKLSSDGSVIGTYAVGGYPVGLALDGSGNVWVANYAADNLMRLSPNGERTATIESATPFGVAVDGLGQIWAIDYKGKKLNRFDAAGKLLGSYETGARPFGVAIANELVWVTNNAGHSVSRFSLDGLSVNAPIRVDREPHWIAADASGNLWLTATGSSRLDKLARHGGVIGSYEVGGVAPWGLGVGPDGTVWVTTSGPESHTVSKFASDGTREATYALPGKPQGVAVDAEGHAWVALQDANAVVKLEK